ncbi:PDR/VanB family oxidoreductase [Actinocrispum sp. NPDC049592]|uniref:PDR/VanB family oxidoreductase n=1 Tax=Actinocrispum sp. NPDC049592 TaxID=3154835 RepID=UPI003449B64F
MSTEHEFSLVVERKGPLADGVVGLVLRCPNGQALPSWEPGAHIDLILTDELTRQYSLCGDPRDSTTFRLAVLRNADGRGGSKHVHDELTEGQLVRVRGPRNNFRLVEAEEYLFIAGGIGITPILPMITQVAACDRPWRLVYGGRTRSAMAFREELEALHPGHVEIHPQDEHGLLDLPTVLARPTPAIYCCGPEPLLTAVEHQCTSGALHLERFAPRADPADGTGEHFEVELARTGTVLTIPPDRSIVDVLDDSGRPVLYSCREGTCGTCETTVLSGMPDHRDSILTAAEQAAGDTMMICVSRSRSPRLVLDL